MLKFVFEGEINSKTRATSIGSSYMHDSVCDVAVFSGSLELLALVECVLLRAFHASSSRLHAYFGFPELTSNQAFDTKTIKTPGQGSSVITQQRKHSAHQFKVSLPYALSDPNLP